MLLLTYTNKQIIRTCVRVLNLRRVEKWKKHLLTSRTAYEAFKFYSVQIYTRQEHLLLVRYTCQRSKSCVRKTVRDAISRSIVILRRAHANHHDSFTIIIRDPPSGGKQ